MKTISGLEAIYVAKEVSKLPGGSFNIAFYPYNRAKNKASAKLRVIKNCKYRSQLPKEQWEADGDNYFLFTDADGNPRTCYRVLLRFIGFPNDNFELRKINWFNS